MVKELEGNNKLENEYKNLGNNCKSIITIRISSLKVNFTPFIPKNYKNQKKLEQKEFLESKNKLYALNELEKEKKISQAAKTILHLMKHLQKSKLAKRNIISIKEKKIAFHLKGMQKILK